MVLTIKNVGRLYDESKIEINGITMVAGKNGSGKSTIGKSLFCTFNSLYDINNKIQSSRVESIRRKLFSYTRSLRRDYSAIKYNPFVVYEMSKNNPEPDIIRDALESAGYPISQIDEQDQQVLLSDIKKIVETQEIDIVRHIVENSFGGRFGGQLQHANHTDEPSLIEVGIRDSKIIIEDNYQSDFVVKEYLPLMKDVIYISDEYTLERNIYSFYRYDNYFNESLHDKIVLRKKSEDVVGDILSEEKYKKIIERMNEARIGELVSGKGQDFEYKEVGLNNPIKVENLSSGTKIMVLIKQIILNGYLEDNGIMILDEPEIHLHPEWQRMLAEIIAIMQVEFNMNFLISTHSSDFVAFIQYFSKLYDINDRYKAYLIKEGQKQNTSEVVDVTDCMDEIYKMLGEPFISVSGEIEYES